MHRDSQSKIDVMNGRKAVQSITQCSVYSFLFQTYSHYRYQIMLVLFKINSEASPESAFNIYVSVYISTFVALIQYLVKHVSSWLFDKYFHNIVSIYNIPRRACYLKVVYSFGYVTCLSIKCRCHDQASRTLHIRVSIIVNFT